MPEFVLPAEADRCPHCGKVLRDPPDCCQKMRDEHAAEFENRYSTPSQTDPWDDVAAWEAEMSWQREQAARRDNGEEYDAEEPARRYDRDY
jgi:hypothetical protein